MHYQAFQRETTMRLTATLALIGSLTITTACATTAPIVNEPEAQPTSQPEPTLIAELPETIDSFEYEGFKYFEDGSGGFSVRYANSKKKRMADFYVYPVAEENTNLEHSQLVLGSTRATLMAISEASQQGHYANFNVVNAATRASGLRTTARVQATYLRQNLASYTLVYQTEHQGTLLKIRLSMPDNEHNRTTEEWDKFADQMFTKAIKNLEASKLTASANNTEESVTQPDTQTGS